jgi:Short C-terminal domain
MLILVILGVYLVIVFAVGKTAENNGRNPFPWVCLAAVLGILAFIPLLIAGPSESKRLTELADEEERRARMLISPTAQLRELAELKDAGLVTSEEFEAKKALLLDRI